MARKASLVSEYIENINREMLEKYARQIRNYAKSRNGIYVLYSGSKLYYVGLATSLSGRLAAHLKDRHKENWDSFSMYLTSDSGYLREIESLLLRVTMPTGNIAKGKLKGSVNLLKNFQADLKHQFKVELDFLTGKRQDRNLNIVRGKPKDNQTDLVSYGLHSVAIRGTHRGQVYKGRINKDGWVIIKNKRYPSLSAAASQTLGIAVNGWKFWKIQSKSKGWILADKLR